ncbi:MAG: TatD family hydrolase [Deltaproteobacteria bacterium]|nr:TatD family hydrolase [Deltaproteobacteria bacterium]
MKNIKADLPVLGENAYLIDSHCHLDMDSYEIDLAAVMDRAVKNQIRRIVTIGINLPSSRKAVLLSQKHPDLISATIGIHPHDAGNLKSGTYDKLGRLYADHMDYIVGYGEIGLDYMKNYSPLDEQRHHFRRQLDLARELKLPVIIHNREADDDTLTILKKARPLHHGGIMHCFSGDYDFARQVLDLGLLISIPGIVTFTNAARLHDVVRKIPLTTLALETDGPFLAPHPFRGKRNEPSLMLYTAKKIAELKNCSIEEVARQTSANAEKLFQFDQRQ